MAAVDFAASSDPARGCSIACREELFLGFRPEGKNQLTGSKRSKKSAASRTTTMAATTQPTRKRTICVVHGTPSQRNVSITFEGESAMVREKLSLYPGI